jgi:phage shock protein PspC (stress-responsive transcriptional regulator)
MDTITQTHTVESHPLRRITGGRMIAGVAGGMAEYFDLDVTIVRLAFVVLAFLGGLGLPLYIAGWLLIPESGSDTSFAEGMLHRHRHYDCPACDAEAAQAAHAANAADAGDAGDTQ